MRLSAAGRTYLWQVAKLPDSITEAAGIPGLTRLLNHDYGWTSFWASMDRHIGTCCARCPPLPNALVAQLRPCMCLYTIHRYFGGHRGCGEPAFLPTNLVWAVPALHAAPMWLPQL